MLNEQNGEMSTAKVPSTPHDSSIGVLNGIARVCEESRVDLSEITHVMHGTTVATNTVLTGTGARVGLVTTKGYRQVLQIARSFVPGGLGGWVIYQKSEPMAPLELTIEADERVSAKGEIVSVLNESSLRESLKNLAKEKIEALTVCLINSFTNKIHEEKVRDIALEIMPEVPVSISSEVIPELQEYERAVTTVTNSYVRPKVETYINNLESELLEKMKEVKLSILRSDGGLASAQSAAKYPVNMLMSGPAGGVAGAIWVAGNAGFKNLLTLDIGGTSTDVALVQNGHAQLRRETTVGDVTVRASSVDVRTVGAGGGSIAHVPAVTKALRVGPQSAGAEPGPAAYGNGGLEPTVTDANIVLGYIPSRARLGGDMAIDVDAAQLAVGRIASDLGLSVEAAAEGIYNIVNENMFGALRLVSVEQGHDPREFALIAFGGAGPLHANALGKLMGSWPVIIPPGPGVLCAYGDATTRLRNEASRTFIRKFSATSNEELRLELEKLATSALSALVEEKATSEGSEITYQLDLRYQGQGLSLTVDVSLAEGEDVLTAIGTQFDLMHEQLFTFSLPAEKEIVNLRSIALGEEARVEVPSVTIDPDFVNKSEGNQRMFAEGQWWDASIYDRSKVGRGTAINGPAIVTEMDSTTMILPEHVGRIDSFGNILITPITQD
ncbi:MAG: hydantoinase/oxoprolinase family protein [Proteobacteria bacterium]|nr:hydantoinase/oxoprolinase family protein [Pseudomonadota bacterium]MBT6194039.1 hydantoinase/oxoprolinase family protein [Pseudomonadota bacterium]MBT6464299.1 hydantoinase/oxoprolinase family protein [Pseudomonadota bacterium]MBT6674294.1 hydantoinase/oxoprolinase family protein [Pseudomonadota bacterium]MBT7246398.1 hydantoinase/oxoprolinase family protein [Pseudomonadota bacterium]